MAALGTTALSLPSVPWLAEQPLRWQVFAHPELLSLFGDAHLVREIGLAFRQAFPHENEPEALMNALLSDQILFSEVYISQLVKDDFAQGRTVHLDGWILSRTEARQCALFSMLPS